MKPGSIYTAFNSKENLYLLALERYFETARALQRTDDKGTFIARGVGGTHPVLCGAYTK